MPGKGIKIELEMFFRDLMKFRKKLLNVRYGSLSVIRYGIDLDTVTGREYQALLNVPSLMQLCQTCIKRRFLE
jgi:hypothetical protein